MRSRLRFLVLATLIAVLCFASTSVALEKTSARFTDTHPGNWNRASTSCQVVYYNTCTGWIWVWSGWNANSTLGVWFSSCCPGGYATHQLLDTFIYFPTGSPSGYGFTGTLDVWSADTQGCPTGPALRSSPFLPTSGWNSMSFNSNPVDVSGGDFVVTMTTGATTVGNPMSIATDHPLAGPTGPAACGTCFPTTRLTRTFYYGTPSSPICPGSALNDGLCDAALIWDVDVACGTTAVQGKTWGQIKDLYR